MKKLNSKQIKQIYNKEYYLENCTGHNEFIYFDEDNMLTRYKKAISLAGDLKDKRVLDVGCGRGEVACYCALRGAEVLGIDYSPDAIELANSLKTKLIPQEKQIKINFVQLDVTEMQSEYQKQFDLIFMLDVVEHLSESELENTVKCLYNLLSDNGVLIIHTDENNLFYKYGYPLLRFIQILRGRSENYPNNPRGNINKFVHINEQNIFGLKKTLTRAGFIAKVWMAPLKDNNKITTFFSKKQFYYYLFIRFFPFNIFFGDQIFAIARKH